MGRELFLSGNEACALAAYDSGCLFASGYPGTPSTEILENLGTYNSVNTSWATNEKVALELCIGASFAGRRSLAVMKHVGVNVAADPLMTLSYTGIKGGLVIVTCDDPGMHSSQNEQDNRHYALFAKIPMLEPSSSAEVYNFLTAAFYISEKFDTPVLFRLTTRICHSHSRVFPGKKSELPASGFTINNQKYVMIPAWARMRHVFIEKRLALLEKFSCSSKFNIFEKGAGSRLIITSGISYQYVRENFINLPVLKLGMTWPFPAEKVRKISCRFKEVMCVEELDPFLENACLVSGVNNIIKRPKNFYIGELNPERVKALLVNFKDFIKPVKQNIPAARPPALCRGCPHAFMFEIFRDYGLIVAGDIGCYTLGTLSPYNALHACIDMGASIPVGLALRAASAGKQKNKIISVIGDSTFFHSGITGLIDAVYNKRSGLIVILDNRSTAMTGGQDHPGTGKTLPGNISVRLDIEKIVRACGVNRVFQVDPFKKTETAAVIKKSLALKEIVVIIATRECIIYGPQKR
ncbi:MAG: hypothetical protein A2096_07145 [Spirochaetes bacterium GWF1_41_5]|nr:MAG: hypothetical protein A2096_07145 [Spirochaetes bacterium GWF1_41_5]HBE04618.1 indolepyruvate ferredoxin oxidoreductase subunit alpha [Spirochaetia bacterium]